MKWSYLEYIVGSQLGANTVRSKELLSSGIQLKPKLQDSDGGSRKNTLFVFLKFSIAALRNAQDYFYNRRDCTHVCSRITWSYPWLNHSLAFNPITLQSHRLNLPLLDVCLKLHTAGKYYILETRLKTWQTKTFDILPVFLWKCNNCPFYLFFSLQERKERRGDW